MFVAPFAAPFPSPVASSGAAAVPWYLAGGVALANVVAAYQPIGAASLAASYSNLANPGTNDAAPGVAPTWASATGWTFNGSTQYLTSGIAPASGYSVIVRFSGVTLAGDKYAFASYAGSSTTYVRIMPHATARTIYSNGGDLLISDGGTASGVLAIAGNKGYKDGSAATGTIGAWSGTNTRPIYIGCRNNQGTADGFTAIVVQAFAIYNTVLTAPQVAAITAAMQALTG